MVISLTHHSSSGTLAPPPPPPDPQRPPLPQKRKLLGTPLIPEREERRSGGALPACLPACLPAITLVTMGRRRVPASSAVVVAAAVVMVACGWGGGVARGDFATDQAECAEALVGLSTCLTYVEGSAKAPTPDCCTGMKQVIGKSPKCLCILIKDRDNPQLGFKIDATRAMSLPGVCSVPANISHCPRILKLDPNSKDAEVFKQFGTAPKQGNATSSSNIESGVPSSSSSPGSSGGDKAKDSSSSGAGGRSHFLLGQQRWLQGVEVTGGLWVPCVLALSLAVMLGG